MKMLPLIRRISATCIFITLLSIPAAAFAKRPPPPPPPDPDPVPIGTTELISKSSDGTQANNQSSDPAITPDGRYVLFASSASNLVANDSNGEYDIFVHDRITGTTERVSVATDGTETDDASYNGSISADGRFVAFSSNASNLVAGEQTFFSQVYVRDRLNGITERISVSTDGVLGNASSSSTTISADGRYIAFTSNADNLVAGDTNGYYSDIFVHDRLNGTTERISVASDGSEANHRSALPGMSADGQIVVFLSDASNLVPGDTNNSTDIFVHNRVTGITERVSIASDGSQADNDCIGPAISADGNVVSFSSTAGNLVSGGSNYFNQVFVHDRTTGVTQRISQTDDGTPANDESFAGSLSADGRHVAFFSYGNNLDMPYSSINWWYADVFVYDRVTQQREHISLTPNGLVPSDDSTYPAISADGRFVAFESYAADLLETDNGLYTNDIFVRDRNP